MSKMTFDKASDEHLALRQFGALLRKSKVLRTIFATTAKWLISLSMLAIVEQGAYSTILSALASSLAGNSNIIDGRKVPRCSKPWANARARATHRNTAEYLHAGIIHRAMKAGRLSYARDAGGERRIEVAELERVFGVKKSTMVELTKVDGAIPGNGAASIASNDTHGAERVALQRLLDDRESTILDLREGRGAAAGGRGAAPADRSSPGRRGCHGGDDGLIEWPRVTVAETPQPARLRAAQRRYPAGSARSSPSRCAASRRPDAARRSTSPRSRVEGDRTGRG